MTDSKNLLIVFTRFPRPGNTKKRLAKVIGDEAAADCQRQMTELIVSVARKFCCNSRVELQIHYCDSTPEEMAVWLGDDLGYYPQTDGDIGDKMRDAFSLGFQNGWDNIVLIGADCPDISAEILKTAFNALNLADLVLGPALDGGYYLIGLHAPNPDLFSLVWGSDAVLRQTIKIAENKNIVVQQIKALHDIDHPADLKYFHNYTRPK